MKKMIYTFILCLVLGSNILSAQYANNKEALSFRGIFPNYQFQLNNELNGNDFTAGFQLEYTRHLSDAFNLAIPFTMASADYPTDDIGSNFREGVYLGMDALLQAKLFDSKYTLNPSLYAGVGFNVEGFDAFNVNLPIGLLFDIKLDDNFYLSPKVEYRVGLEDNRNNLMPGIGFKVLIGEGAPDTDKDGVPDTEDQCPTQAGLAALNGCPDQDGDGVKPA